MRLSNPSFCASRTLGRSSSTGPAGRHHAAWLIAVTMTDRVSRALVADTAEELRHLVLQGLLQDQSRAEPTGPLDRIGLAVDAGQHMSSSRRNRALGATLAMRAYLHQLRLVGATRRLRPPYLSPGPWDGTPMRHKSSLQRSRRFASRFAGAS
jgi:hypothetical protein